MKVLLNNSDPDRITVTPIVTRPLAPHEEGRMTAYGWALTALERPLHDSDLPKVVKAIAPNWEPYTPLARVYAARRFLRHQESEIIFDGPLFFTEDSLEAQPV